MTTYPTVLLFVFLPPPKKKPTKFLNWIKLYCCQKIQLLCLDELIHSLPPWFLGSPYLFTPHLFYCCSCFHFFFFFFSVHRAFFLHLCSHFGSDSHRYWFFFFFPVCVWFFCLFFVLFPIYIFFFLPCISRVSSCCWCVLYNFIH